MTSEAWASNIISSPQVYYFSGTCGDCSGTATAELTLTGDYTLGASLTTSNFLSFHYDGTNLLPAFTINSGDSGLYVFGSLTTIPGSQRCSGFEHHLNLQFFHEWRLVHRWVL